MGLLWTAMSSPMRLCRSAKGPPNRPCHASKIASRCSSVAFASTYETRFQLFGTNTLPGIFTTCTYVNPETSTPLIEPLSIWYALNESHEPPSGSSPIQQRHSVRHEQASSSEPS